MTRWFVTSLSLAKTRISQMVGSVLLFVVIILNAAVCYFGAIYATYAELLLQSRLCPVCAPEAARRVSPS